MQPSLTAAPAAAPLQIIQRSFTYIGKRDRTVLMIVLHCSVRMHELVIQHACACIVKLMIKLAGYRAPYTHVGYRYK